MSKVRTGAPACVPTLASLILCPHSPFWYHDARTTGEMGMKSTTAVRTNRLAILAALAERITGKLQDEGRKLLQ